MKRLQQGRTPFDGLRRVHRLPSVAALFCPQVVLGNRALHLSSPTQAKGSCLPLLQRYLARPNLTVDKHSCEERCRVEHHPLAGGVRRVPQEGHRGSLEWRVSTLATTPPPSLTLLAGTDGVYAWQIQLQQGRGHLQLFVLWRSSLLVRISPRTGAHQLVVLTVRASSFLQIQHQVRQW